MKHDEPQTKSTQKTLEQLFNEPVAVNIDRAQMHQGFQIPGAGTETTLHCGRNQCQTLKLRFHPGYGLIGYLKGKYFLSPSANVIVGHE